MLMPMNIDTPLQSLAHPPLIPKGRIGRFVYEQEIGHGSAGMVYLFRDPLIGRKVAIKVLNPQLPAAQRQLFEKHFIQEARAAGRLNHPNIVTVYDADKSGDLLFIVMEYLEGKELRDLMSNGHAFSYRQIADLVARIANALDYAHEHGVIHRDIKPANIFISDKGAPKVLDFGIASASRQLADTDATVDTDLLERRLLGTPNYMSPEQAKSEVVDARSDIFSLGVVLYQLLCGQLPFKADGIPRLLQAIAHDPAIPPQEIKADVPLRLARIAAKALAKKPAERYQRAADMARDLNRFLEKERTERIIAKIQQPESEKANLNGKSRPEKDRRVAASKGTPTRQAGLLLGAAILLGIIFWFWFRPGATKLTPGLRPPQAASGAAALTLAEPPPTSLTATFSRPVTEEKVELKQDISSAAASAATSVVTSKAVPAVAQLAQEKPTKPLKIKTPAAISKHEATAVSSGVVLIAVSPWGEVSVDGQVKGVAPPLTKLSLAAGKHKIEIKNGDDSYAVNIEVTSEKEVKVTHRF